MARRNFFDCSRETAQARVAALGWEMLIDPSLGNATAIYQMLSTIESADLSNEQFATMLDIVNSRERERSIAFRQEMLETPMPRHQRRAKKIGEGSEAEVYKIKDCVIKTYATGKESFNYIREAELDRRIMAAAAMRGVECFEQMCAASFSALNAAFNFVPGQTLDDDEMNYNTLGTPTIPIYNLDSQITSFAFEDPRSENFILKPDGTIVRIDYKVPFEQERRFTELIESGGLLARAVNSVALV